MATGGKTDMERVALFKEMTYHTIGDPYVAPGQLQFNEAASKGRQILPGGPKEKSALSVGYFSEFQRVFEGEGFSDPIRMRMLQRNERTKNKLGKDWVPSSGNKMPSGIGSFYGTFSGSIPHFEGMNRSATSYKAPGKNLYTSPGKQGTGYGYLGVTIGKYPEYKSEPYERNLDLQRKENESFKSKIAGRGAFHLNMHSVDYFDLNPYKGESLAATNKERSASGNKDNRPFRPSNPGKRPGGMKAGTFDPFPAQSSDPYVVKNLDRPVKVVNNSGKICMPSSGPKSAPINSVLHQNILRSLNSQNYKTVTSIMSY